MRLAQEINKKITFSFGWYKVFLNSQKFVQFCVEYRTGIKLVVALVVEVVGIGSPCFVKR